jgi:hypothetical protein
MKAANWKPDQMNMAIYIGWRNRAGKTPSKRSSNAKKTEQENATKSRRKDSRGRHM